MTDWRGTPIVVGSVVVYVSNGWVEGRVTAIEATRLVVQTINSSVPYFVSRTVRVLRTSVTVIDNPEKV